MLNKIPIALILLSFILVFETNAQSTNASILGHVTDEKGEPLSGATVFLTNSSTGFQTGVATDASGNFTFRQLPLGGPYELKVSFVGYAEETITDIEVNLGDRLEFQFDLSLATDEMSEIVVSAGQINNIENLGSTKSVSSREIQSLPIPDRNFTNLGDLSPEMGPDLALGGNRNMSTNVTLDGANLRGQLTGDELARGPFSISMEAIREFEISTNDYDVTQGRQSGGSINAVTKSGTNTHTGSIFAYHRNDKLTANEDFQGRALGEFTTTQYGLAVGGPIIKDKLHYFVAYDRQDEAIPRFINDLSSPQQEANFNITEENFEEVIGILESQYGMEEQRQRGEFTRNTTANAIFARLDWNINETHTFTFRNNYTDWDDPISGGGDQALSMRESIWDFWSVENSALASLRSTFSENFTNELKVQYQYAERAFDLGVGKIPRSFVRVNSVLDDGSEVSTQIQFGGHRWSPETNEEQTIQLMNTSYLSVGDYELTIGGDIMATYLQNYISNELGGLFTFDSIEELRNKEPSSYYRQAPLNDPRPVQKYWMLDAGIFAQMDMNLHDNLRAEFGLRYDVTGFLTEPGYNPRAEEELGIRTDSNPTDWTGIQPRVQLTWDVRGNGQDIIKVGGGAFKSQPHYYIHYNNLLNNGLELGTLNLDEAAGDEIPDPDYESFREDIANNPGVPSGTTIEDLPPPFIATMEQDYRTPMTWKGNVSYNRIFSDAFRVGINVKGSFTPNNYHYIDENLNEEPYFSIDPDNKPVFVPASTVNITSGRTNDLFSRESEEFDHVMVFSDDAKTRTYGFVIDSEYRFPNKNLVVSGSYTWNKAEDQSSYNCCQWGTGLNQPTQGNPNELEWARSGNEFRHKVVLSAIFPVWKGFMLNASYVGISGTPFSLLVNSDISGNGSSNNDLAFIYDPNDPSTPAHIAEGMRNAIDNAEPRVAEYLRDNAGQRAERNGLNSEFYHTLNARISKNISFGERQSLDIIVDVFNSLHFINEDWGGRFNFNNNRDLLFVTGFDPNSEQFQYSVNESVGEVPESGDVYQVQLGLKYNF